MNTCLILLPTIMLDCLMFTLGQGHVQPRVCENEAASSLSETAGPRSFHPQLSLQPGCS